MGSGARKNVATAQGEAINGNFTWFQLRATQGLRSKGHNKKYKRHFSWPARSSKVEALNARESVAPGRSSRLWHGCSWPRGPRAMVRVCAGRVQNHPCTNPLSI